MFRPRIAALAVALLLSACQPAPTPPEQEPAKPVVRTVAVATLMTHPSLDLIVSSMKTEMEAKGFKEGETVQYTIRNANGDANAAVGILRELELSGPDVVVAITTPVAQAAIKEVRSPLVFSAVTDPVGAGVVDSMEKPPAAITGVSDQWPYKAQLELARSLVPGAKTLGVVFNPGEAASQYGIGQIRTLAPPLGFQVTEIPVSNTGEILGALKVKAPGLDAIFLSSDNTVISGVPAALSVSFDQKKPLFVGDAGTVEQGGLAAVSVGYDGVGRETAKLVVRMLAGDRNIPVVVASDAEAYLNADTAKRIGLEIPADVRARAKKVYGTP